MVELEKNLGYISIISILVTAIVGTGLFVGPVIAASVAGVDSIIAWILLGILSIYIAACFGELVSLYPTSGGVYTYAKKSYNRFIAFIIGWITWLVNAISIPIFIITALNYISIVSNTLKLIIGILLIIILNIIAYKGKDLGKSTIIIFAILTISLILIILIPGLLNINTNNFGNLFTNSISSVFIALFFIMETFFGWEEATFLAEETKNAEKVIPKALILVTSTIVLLTILIAIMMIGNTNMENLIQISDPFAYFSNMFYGQNSIVFVNIGIFLTLLGAASGNVIATPRLIQAMAKDKLFIEQLGDIHPKNKTPYKAIIFQTIFSILILLISKGNYIFILSVLIPLGMFMYISTIMTLPILRLKNKSKREFKVPFGKSGPIIISIIFIITIVMWTTYDNEAPAILLMSLSLVSFSIPIYLILNLYYNPKFSVTIIDKLATLNHILSYITISPKIKRDIKNMFPKDKIQGKTVLLYGSGGYNIVYLLSKLIGNKGKLIVVEQSLSSLKIIKKRNIKNDIKNVYLIYDPRQISRIHPDINKVDIIYSIGNISYIQDLKIVMKQMYNILPDQGRILFIEYIDMFKIIPNKGWLSNIKYLTKVINETGFSARIEKNKGLLWNYIYIIGIKTKDNVPFI